MQMGRQVLGRARCLPVNRRPPEGSRSPVLLLLSGMRLPGGRPGPCCRADRTTGGIDDARLDQVAILAGWASNLRGMFGWPPSGSKRMDCGHAAEHRPCDFGESPEPETVI